MQRALKWLLPAVLVLLLGAVIGRAVIARRAPQAPGPSSAAAAALELAPTDLVVARRQALVRRLPLSGSLEAVRTAVVKAKVAGELRSLDVREGDTVQAGQLIGQLDTSEYDMRLKQAREQAASAEAQLDIAERTLQNNRALVDQGFISRNALDTSVSNAAAARATLLAAQASADLARKSLDDTALRSPIPGQVSQRFAQAGERVGVDARVVEIVDLSRIEMKAALPPEDVAQLHIGSVASLQVEGLAQAVPARVVRINPGTAAGTRAVTVYLSVQPHPALRHGLFASGWVALGEHTAVAVPEASVRLDRPSPYVLVLQGGRVVQRPVVLGERGRGADGTDGWVAVTGGLAEGDAVLHASLGAVREGTPARVTTLPATPAASR